MQLPRKMSAQNVMASITRSLGTRSARESHMKASNEIKFAGEESKDKLYEPKHRKKAFRVMTVIAYVISVSLAAIILSLYYVFIWNPKDHTQFSLKLAHRFNGSSKVDFFNISLVQTTLDSITILNETYEEKSSQMSSTNQTKLIDKLKTICASTHEETSKKSELRNSNNGSTIDSVVTTVKNRILELHEKNIDETL